MRNFLHLQHFGEQFRDFHRVVKMLDSLGLKEDEMIEHSMVNNAIEKAQKRVEYSLSVKGASMASTRKSSVHRSGYALAASLLITMFSTVS